MMYYPFNCLLYCSQADETKTSFLAAASGPCIHIFDASNGSFVSTWRSSESFVVEKKSEENGSSLNEDTALRNNTEQSPQPPAKRQRLSPPKADHSESSSAEIVVESEGPPIQNVSPPSVIKLAGTRDGRYIVAVTGEDKCIRVFDLSGSGVLQQRSERNMPKRPSAIVLTADDSTILCADKFGDVYALPLIGKIYEALPGDADANGSNAQKSTKEALQPFVPSASTLTVHTKRNLDSLRQQQSLKKKEPKKPSLTFDCQLLLGHVSMLIDVACAYIESSPGERRKYILTADRDEHIRVSRGIPQSHITEGYCLGHTQFVSKLCLVPSEPQLLMSGGGDDFLLTWDWLSGKVKQKIDLRGPVDAFRNQSGHPVSQPTPVENQEPGPVGDDSIGRLTVSSIKILESRAEQYINNHVIVTVEGVPALFLFALNNMVEIQYLEAYGVEGNVIDTTVVQDSRSVVYSMDTAHEAFSTNMLVEDLKQGERPSIGAMHFSTESQKFEKDLDLYENFIPAIEAAPKHQIDEEQKGAAKGKSLSDLLYSLGSLRKRGSED